MALEIDLSILPPCPIALEDRNLITNRHNFLSSFSWRSLDLHWDFYCASKLSFISCFNRERMMTSSCHAVWNIVKNISVMKVDHYTLISVQEWRDSLKLSSWPLNDYIKSAILLFAVLWDDFQLNPYWTDKLEFLVKFSNKFVQRKLFIFNNFIFIL